MGMSDVMDDWLGFDPPKPPPLPPMQAPQPIPSRGDPMGAYRRGRSRKGRAETILTGDLVPLDIGKRTLLG